MHKHKFLGVFLKSKKKNPISIPFILYSSFIALILLMLLFYIWMLRNLIFKNSIEHLKCLKSIDFPSWKWSVILWEYYFMEIALHFTVYKILYFIETFSKSNYYCFCTIITIRKKNDIVNFLPHKWTIG